MIRIPYNEELVKLQQTYTSIELDLEQLIGRINWYTEFNAQNAHQCVLAADRAIIAASTALDEMQSREEQMQSGIRSLIESTLAGLDPRYWFSSERAVAKRNYEMCLENLKNFQAESKLKAKELKTYINEQEKLRDRLNRELEKFRSIDFLADQAKMVALELQLSQLQSELTRLREMKGELDKKIAPNLDAIRKSEIERNNIILDIEKLKEFERQLACKDRPVRASQIHEACEAKFGHSSPRYVKSKREGALKRIDADIGKIEKRIKNILKLALLDVRKLIIDGNNLCYQGEKFIGLEPLKVLTSTYASKYEIIVIFDATIRRKLKMLDKEIFATLPDVKVHVVASRRKADETVLAAAESQAHTFVVSNDKYPEYTDYDAVINDRVVRHEIVNNNSKRMGNYIPLPISSANFFRNEVDRIDL